MSGGDAKNGSNYQKRLEAYSTAIRNRAWLISLGLTVWGTAAMIALTGRPPLRALASAPLSWLIIYVALRIGARYSLTMAGGVSRPGVDLDETLEYPNVTRPEVRPSLLARRRDIFGMGLVLIGLAVMATAALWAAGGGGRQPLDVLAWFLLALLALNSFRLWRSFDPMRIAERVAGGRSPASADGALASRAWIAVANVIIVSDVGMALAIFSSEWWLLIPYGVLALLTAVMFWTRLGGVAQVLAANN